MLKIWKQGKFLNTNGTIWFYDRRYIAILSGKINNEGGTIANWLKDNKMYVTYSSPIDNGGKYAVTHFHVLKTTDTHSLVEFTLETGRKTKYVFMRLTSGTQCVAILNTVMATIQ